MNATAAAPPELPGVEHRWVRAGDVTLHVAEAGPADAPPLVLLHGWPQHWYVWRRVIPLLAGERRVIAPDLRGFGWSDAPRTSYRKEELAGDVVKLLDALELPAVALGGHDWGAFVGFLACLRAPERFSSFTAMSIIHPWASLPVTPKTVRKAGYQFLVGAPVLGARVQRHTPLLAALRKLSAAPWSDEEMEVFAERFRPADHAEASSRVYRVFLREERAAIHGGAYADRRLTVPTRLLAGRRDPVVSPRVLEGYESHADAMEVEWVDGTHWLPEESPELVADRLLHAPGPSI